MLQGDPSFVGGTAPAGKVESIVFVTASDGTTEAAGTAAEGEGDIRSIGHEAASDGTTEAAATAAEGEVARTGPAVASSEPTEAGHTAESRRTGTFAEGGESLSTTVTTTERFTKADFFVLEKCVQVAEKQYKGKLTCER